MNMLYPHTIRTLPKVDLHRHLDCSMRFSTMLELAESCGIKLPKTYQEQMDTFLITQPMINLEAVLVKFLNAQKLLSSKEILARLAFEACEDAYNDGVQILELRYAPTFITDGHPQLTFEDIHLAFLNGIEKAKKYFPMKIGLICIVQRIRSLEIASQVIAFAIEHKNTFVGIDLADNEEKFEARPFAPLFLKAKKAGLHITIHSGETPSPNAAKWIEESIELLGAERIGHGIQAIQSNKTMKLLADKKIPLEICPISNCLTQAFPDFQSHPIRRLQEYGVLVTINSDDPGIFHTRLSDDYEVLNRVFGFNVKDFANCNEIAKKFSFIKEVSHA